MNDKIASAQERQEFWTEIMRSEGESVINRIKASELLGKVQGDFSGAHENSYLGLTGDNFDRLTDEQLLELIERG